MSKLVLVVDDSMLIRTQLRGTLERAGYEVAEADSGAAALDVARQRAAALVIMDVNMPGADGLSTVAEMRKLEGYGKTPVLVLTTESTRAQVQRGREVGATAWMVKPYIEDVLLKGVGKLTA